jgi:uncharacterized membrane protein YphA (DoxX/SURF4 family)
MKLKSAILENDTLIATLLTVMFVFSGLNKINNFNSTATKIQNAFGLKVPLSVYQIISVLVILLEVFAPIVIIYFFYTRKNKKYAYTASLALAIFTLVATVVYHPPHLTSYNKSIPFWANVSLFGGLLLLAKYIGSM